MCPIRCDTLAYGKKLKNVTVPHILNFNFPIKTPKLLNFEIQVLVIEFPNFAKPDIWQTFYILADYKF